LEERKAEWETEQKHVSCFDQIKTLPEKKKQRPSLKQVHSQVLPCLPALKAPRFSHGDESAGHLSLLYKIIFCCQKFILGNYFHA